MAKYKVISGGDAIDYSLQSGIPLFVVQTKQLSKIRGVEIEDGFVNLGKHRCMTANPSMSANLKELWDMVENYGKNSVHTIKYRSLAQKWINKFFKNHAYLLENQDVKDYYDKAHQLLKSVKYIIHFNFDGAFRSNRYEFPDCSAVIVQDNYLIQEGIHGTRCKNSLDRGTIPSMDLSARYPTSIKITIKSCVYEKFKEDPHVLGLMSGIGYKESL